MPSAANHTVRVGPIAGHYLEYRSEQDSLGHYAVGALVDGATAVGLKDLRSLRVGPFKDARFAYLMLVSSVQLQLENAVGGFGGLQRVSAEVQLT